jgi:mono/diheme cytochrome c family protein
VQRDMLDRSRWLKRFSLIACAATALACGPSAPADVAVSKQDQAEAERIFSTRCAKCHGLTGHGDGPDARALNPKPRNFSDSAWHLAVSDRRIDKVIVEGGPSFGKSAVMRPNPDLADKPAVVVALRQHLRMLAGSE